MKPIVRKILAGVVVLAIGAVAGPWIYINLIKQDAPDVLTLEPSVTTTTAAGEPAETTTTVATTVTTVATSATDGEWAVVAESIVGYRVKEIIVGQKTEGVGRTSAVTGSLKIADQKVLNAEFTVDMTTLKSDSTRRDRQVNTRILDTATYPTATFVLKEPITLTPEVLAGSELTVNTTGTLTLRGVTKDIAVTLIARLVDDVIEVNGSIELVFADWSIPDPSISAIVVEDRGQLEFLIRFAR
ncbi:MAG: YceI family protein [Acidimicrobiaceae bacterium]|nr:YceI family protein [Acidimicrobiaceae bacterium]